MDNTIETEAERSERRQRLTEVSGMLRVALQLVTKGQPPDHVSDDEVAAAIRAIRELKARVDSALAQIVATETETEKTEVKSHMPTQRKNMDVSRLVGSLISMFKAVPADKLEDLTDALDSGAPVGTDLWNGGDRNPNQRRSPTGRPLAASGSGGAEAVAEYSSDRGAVVPGTTGHGDGNVRSYDELAGELVATKSRVAELEKGQMAIATAFSALLGMSKNAKLGKADDAPGPVERDGNYREDEDEDVEKSGIHSMTIAQMMDAVSGRARQAGHATPPNFAMLKARVAGDDLSGLTTDEANDVLALRQRMAAYQAGHITERQLYQGLDSLPAEYRGQ